MKVITNAILIALLLSCYACKTDTPKSNDLKEDNSTESEMVAHYPSWSKNANMYEVNIRQYTPEGTFAAFEKHLPRLKEMGVDILWLMPIYPISETKKKGSLGSYYAVSDFAKVNPEFGTLEEFKSMVKSIHAAGMKIILDFVPNHTGWDHVWITEHPGYYTQDEKGNIVDPIDPSTGKSWGWTDVADLNFENTEMRTAMIEDMLYWLNSEQVDGYRMDVAHGVPIDFWKEVSTALTEAKPDVFMLAESEVPPLRNNKYFQTDYGWGFHHILNDIAKGKKGPEDVKEWYHTNTSKYTEGWHIHFTSNHDENSWAGTTKERMGAAHDALATLAYTLDGMPLVYGGQEEPLEKRLEFFEKDDIGFGDYEKAEWYKTMLDLKHRNEALWNGPFGGKPEFLAANDQILAYKREKNGFAIYCMINLSNKDANLTIENDIEKVVDVMSKETVNYSTGDELSFEPWEYKIFSN